MELTRAEKRLIEHAQSYHEMNWNTGHCRCGADLNWKGGMPSVTKYAQHFFEAIFILGKAAAYTEEVDDVAPIDGDRTGTQPASGLGE